MNPNQTEGLTEREAQERLAFETWAQVNLTAAQRQNIADGEKHGESLSWRIWQARATLAVEVPTKPAEVQPAVPVSTLSRMFEPLDGVEKNAIGFHWRRGWNDALRRAMDYATPPAPLLPVQGVLTDEQIEAMRRAYHDAGGSWREIFTAVFRAALSAAAPPQQPLGDALRPELSAALRSAAISIAAPGVQSDSTNTDAA